ncbi:ypgQ [Acrasis kona]|uniref:YpgQ n=1 Tax=Acrasis kona TaxID=1008807 RepID=A0AAW2ZK63_9EUKA
MNIIEQTVQYVKDSLSSNDASHDYAHIERVYKMAIKIAHDESVESELDLEVIKLGALLHDVHDYKYSGSETAGPEAVQKFLNEAGYPSNLTDRVVYIVKNISYSKEMESNGNHVETPLELRIVQDADRLDALGAIGIGRTMVFSGSKGRPMYDPNIKPNINMSKKEYMDKKNDTAINHFYEKLFKLKDLMKTESGRRIAQKRHEFMELYVDHFKKEWEAEI